MKNTYFFTWKAIGISLLMLLSTGVCLAAFNQTDQTDQTSSSTTAANTIATRTPNSDTIPTRTPIAEPSATQTTEPVASETATPLPGIEPSNNLIAYLPLMHKQPSQNGVGVCGGLVQEAEQGVLFGNMQIGNDSGASGGQFIYVPSGSAIDTLNKNHRADYCVSVAQSGQYSIKGWISAEESNSDSFFVTLDGAPSAGIHWVTKKTKVFQEDFVKEQGQSDPQIFNLSAGQHTLSVYYKEANTKLDRFEFLSASGEPVATPVPGNPTATPKPGGGGSGGGGNNNPTATPSAGNVDGWPMAGANLERTSSVEDGPNPQEHSSYGIKWFRPIEAYIGQHVQLIAARGNIYAATAKGLYALNAENGDIAWRFDTDMPLGHSPTVDGDRIFVGGFDKRVYGLNADTGALIWTFEGADGGFSTNPVVVDGQVLMGSRDGYFYSINRENGQLNWQYPPANQAPLGPILFSAAYKDGKVYFASNDNHGYALNISNGSLAWKSAQLPGDGYQAFWPVIYQDYVVFNAAPSYVHDGDVGVHSLDNEDRRPDFIVNTQRYDIYPSGEQLSMTAPDIANYLEEKPWRRSSIVLNLSNGQEFTYDSDGDNKPEYAPLLFTGTKSGNKYPPIIINGEFYAQNMTATGKEGAGAIGRSSLTKWTLGTTDTEFVGSVHAVDEPYADSAAGDMLYSNLCCDRVGTYTNIATGEDGNFWNYQSTLETVNRENPESYQRSLAPGYDVMWWEASMYGMLPRLNGAYGGVNGIYHNHGPQNPMVPYGNMLFLHRSNAIIALGPDTTTVEQRVVSEESIEVYEERIRREYPEFSRPLLEIQPATPQNSLLSAQDVQNLLDREIQKMLDAGHLRPGYYNGTRGDYKEFAAPYENPGETLITLVEAYPKVSPSLQPQLKQYIDEHYQMYFGSTMVSRMGYQGLAAREWMPMPPEVQTAMNNRADDTSTTPGSGWSYPQYNIYGMWKYAETFYANDPVMLNAIYTQAKSKLDKTPEDSTARNHRVWLDNGYIAGYFGFLNLQELAGKSGTDAALRSEISNTLNTSLQNRAATFTKDQPYVIVEKDGHFFNRSYNVARNFIYFTPELADYLRANAASKVNAAIDDYDRVAPYWISVRYEATVREMANDNLNTHSSMFKAKAMFSQESPAQLRKYIDSPAQAVGDLIYIQNLTMALGE